MFDRVLIANRGEIACRIARTVRAMGMEVVAVYSDADSAAPHREMADASVRLPGVASEDTYLNIERIVRAAETTGSDAVHPGYGFLAEHPGLARAVREAGLTFVGPAADVMEQMGEKRRAKNRMEEADVPVVPDVREDTRDPAQMADRAEEIGFPVLIKALAGGGGKGMRRVNSRSEFEDALAACRREARSSFDDDRVLIEKYVPASRHVEVQVFGDQHGNAVHLFERDCSIQRRYQKIVEEGPAPNVSEATRNELHAAAVRAVDALEYTGAGTLEFILDTEADQDGAFYFMEMNTRLQVEHPVTEMITGEDLVEWQLRVAAGESLPRDQEAITADGHALECRIYAEDPAQDFLPRTGRIDRFLRQEGSPDVRWDTGVREGTELGTTYDPLLAKLIVRGEDRPTALRRMEQALGRSGIAGLTTNMELLLNVVRNPAFQRAELDTRFVDQHRSELIPSDYGSAHLRDVCFAAVYLLCGGRAPDPEPGWTDPWAKPDHFRVNGNRRTSLVLQCVGETYEVEATCQNRQYQLSVDGTTLDVQLVAVHGEEWVLDVDGERWRAVLVGQQDHRGVTVLNEARSLPFSVKASELVADEHRGDEEVRATMPGTIVQVHVTEGATVERKDPVVVMESMKMEITVQANRSGTVEAVHVEEGGQVREGDVLISIS
jgi:3-methylcrotonyl-CoA carboxylase alpha subunit